MRRARDASIPVCPGIRPKSGVLWLDNNHVNPATPAEARDAGADYIVCGRPIYEAPDPVAVARAITAELTTPSARTE